MQKLRTTFILFGILLLTLTVASVRQNDNNNNKNARKRNSKNNAAQQQQRQQQQQQNIQPKQKQRNLSSATTSLYLESDEFIYPEDINTDTDISMNTDETREDINLDTKNLPYDIFTCCNEVFGSCRTSCENLSLVQLATATTNEMQSGRGPRLELKKYCPSMQLEFWNCMNRTLEAVARGAQWSGRRCCSLGLLPHCRNACATSTSTDDLINACRRSDEQHMFACFEHQEAGDRCCGNSRTSECLQACRDIFETQTKESNNSHQQLAAACGERNHDVLQCVSNATDMSPLTNSHKYLPCCDYSTKEKCRITCRAVLNATEITDIIFAKLEAAGCGTPLPHLPLWQCFLTATRKLYVPALTNSEHNSNAHRKEVSQLKQIGIDAAKLHCCEKSQTNKCRRLCAQIYSNDWWETRELFESDCLDQPTELELRQCIESVDQPCELSCDGLSFCTNFNNRPTELFRSCNTATDLAALEDLKLLQQRGYVNLLGVTLQIKNTTRCEPTKWKAIVCALHLKPCTRQGLFNNICREDCTELLRECLDYTRMSTKTPSADAICARLQPNGDDQDVDHQQCVSLRPYLEASDAPQETGGHHGLTAPCRGKPCNASEVCVATRNGSMAYQCIPGCSLGETSNYMVPFGSYVRIPVITRSRSAEFMVCRCSAHGRIEHCQPLPSYTHENCIQPGGHTYKHGTSFYLECNLCSCYAEEITCTKKQCRLTGFTDVSYTSLPCNCPTHYVPVCGLNGNTYPSACIAKCLGLQDSEYEYGACGTRSSCQIRENTCPAGMQCLEHRKICLSSMQRPCTQYQCVNQTNNCQTMELSPVCDKKAQTYPNVCELLNRNAQLDYWGTCQRSCSSNGPVCAINGVTYKSECAAWADYVLVDYQGRCREVGLLTHDMGRRCRTVKCSKPVSKYCRHIIPPGACCPICAGGAFRVIYSRKQLDRAIYALRGQHKNMLTLYGVLHELDAVVQVSECQLTGFLSMEVGIFVAIVPRTYGSNNPTRIQIEACTREAEKISSLITAQSHRITTNLALSSLTVSHMIDVSLESACAGVIFNKLLVIIIFWSILLHFRYL